MACGCTLVSEKLMQLESEQDGSVCMLYGVCAPLAVYLWPVCSAVRGCECVCVPPPSQVIAYSCLCVCVGVNITRCACALYVV